MADKKIHVIYTYDDCERTKAYCGGFDNYDDAVEHIRQQIGGEDNSFTLDEMNGDFQIRNNVWGDNGWEYEIITINIK